MGIHHSRTWETM